MLCYFIRKIHIFTINRKATKTDPIEQDSRKFFEIFYKNKFRYCKDSTISRLERYFVLGGNYFTEKKVNSCFLDYLLLFSIP